MASRKLLWTGALAALALAGCADYPYNDPYYGNNAYPSGPAYSDYYGPRGYYEGPTVGFGLTYSDRDGYWDGDHHWHRYNRDRDRDHDRGR